MAHALAASSLASSSDRPPCVDDLIRAEQRVSESEERFSKIFHSGLVAFSIAGSVSGRLVDVNERWAELFGYERHEVIGRTVFELGLWTDAADRQRFIAGISTGGACPHTDAAFRRKSGEVFHGLAAIQPVTLTGIDEPLMMVAIVDVTLRKQLESQLLQAQKMEAVGRLAGGVAHDFNNALAVIQGYAEILLAGNADEGQRSGLEEILQAARRAAGLTRQLLAFSRKQVVDPRALELNALLANLERMLRPLLGEDVELVILPAAELGRVRADAGQLEQVVINLCVNSRHAMPAGGRLGIETANVDVATGAGGADGIPHHEAMTPGRYVRLTVTDTGCGIEPDILARVFEPFFTTKPVGVGTGLGLSMVYGSVKQAGGYVWIDSTPGDGTTVSVYLPRVDDAAVAPSAGEVGGKTSAGTETVLLVEDEAAVRALVRAILFRAGYHVLEACSGAEAIAVAESRSEPIHLLLTDVVMPGMNGRALAESLVAARPDLQVIFMSGYTDDILANHGVLAPGTLFLEKPFTRTALLGKVGEALRDAVAVAAGRV